MAETWKDWPHTRQVQGRVENNYNNNCETAKEETLHEENKIIMHFLYNIKLQKS